MKRPEVSVGVKCVQPCVPDGEREDGQRLIFGVIDVRQVNLNLDAVKAPVEYG